MGAEVKSLPEDNTSTLASHKSFVIAIEPTQFDLIFKEISHAI
jgi:hypothetical protein